MWYEHDIEICANTEFCHNYQHYKQNWILVLETPEKNEHASDSRKDIKREDACFKTKFIVDNPAKKIGYYFT